MLEKYKSLLFQNLGGIIIALDNEGRVTYANKESLDLLGYTAEEMIGCNWFDLIFGEGKNSQLHELYQSIISGKTELFSRESTRDIVAKNGRVISVAWRNNLVRDKNGEVVGIVSFGHDVTEEKLARMRLSLHHEIAQIIMMDSPFAEAAQMFLQAIGLQLGWPLGELWLQKERENVLRRGACWHAEPAHTSFFETACEQLQFSKGVGLPGQVWQTGSPIWLEDVTVCKEFQRREIAIAAGVHAAMGFPVWVGGKITGVIVFFSDRIQPPNEDMLEMYATLGIQIGNYYQHKQSEEQLRVWGELFNNSGEAMLVTDATPKILGVNREFTRLTGYEPDEVIGKNPNVLKSGHHDRVFFQNFWASLVATGYWQGEIWDQRKDGSVYPKWSTISRLKNNQGVTTHYVATFTDISERKAADEKIRYLYHYDPLTGLPNRTLLYERIDAAVERAIRESKHMVVLSMDIDQFKMVNDSMGHDVGDMLIQQMAQRLKECVRDSDTVCRTGGDEFVIVLQHIKNVEEIVPITEKIADQISQPMHVSDTDFNLTASIGVSVFPEDGTDRDTLMRNADIAMNFAKETGRNRYRFFTEDLSEVAAHKMQLVNDLRKALDRNEFVLYYQPQWDILQERMIGVETLIRWHRPGIGIVGPNDFIPIAEESGLIVPIGDWVLAEACRQCREWEDAGLPPLTYAVNISAVQFQQPDFVVKLAELLAVCRSNSILEIEITERIVMGSSEAAVSLLYQLKNIGCRLSIDDFGTGYSSMSYLTRFPVDRLKIDQSFVRTMLASPANMTIVESIIGLAKNLKMRVIAEGVETHEEYRALQERKCDEVQGYYYARPMPADEFFRWRRQKGY